MALRLNPRNVFLNIPYDDAFKPLYLAYITGLVDLGLNPVVTLGIPGGQARLERIFRLIRSSRYSIHDLSRVQLSRTPPPTPRFKMLLEMGMAVAWAHMRPASHDFLVFESVLRRGHKSLSDLAGSDFNIHEETPKGVMRELCSAFVRQAQRPRVPDMMRHYEQVRRAIPKLLRSNGTSSIYEARTLRTSFCWRRK